VTIYTFLFPIDQLPRRGAQVAVIWCSATGEGLERFLQYWQASGNRRNARRRSRRPAARTAPASATPTLMFADGSLIQGDSSPAREEVNKGETETKSSRRRRNSLRLLPAGTTWRYRLSASSSSTSSVDR
jgi:hypothetical protein